MEAAHQLVAELALGLANYNDENHKHACIVEKGKQFNKTVACKHDGYLPLLYLPLEQVLHCCQCMC